MVDAYSIQAHMGAGATPYHIRTTDTIFLLLPASTLRRGGVRTDFAEQVSALISSPLAGEDAGGESRIRSIPPARPSPLKGEGMSHSAGGVAKL
jgi:hypothetical protein